MVLAEKRYSSQPSGSYHQKRRPVRRAKPRKKFFICLQVTVMILSCFGFGLFYIYKSNQAIALGYKIDSKKQSVAVLQRENKKLELEAAELQGPDRVEEVATKKLGMKKPDDILLAALPAESDTISDQNRETPRGQGKQKNIWSLSVKKLIGRAEASSR